MDCSLPGSSVHGILQARILVWVAMHHSLDLLTLQSGLSRGASFVLGPIQIGKLYQVPTAVVTSRHRLGALTIRIYSLPGLEARGKSQSSGRVGSSWRH